MTAPTTSDPAPVPAAVPRAATTISTAAAEWLKLRSLRSTWWFAGGAVALVLVVSLAGGNDGTGDTLRSLGAPSAAIQYFIQYIAAAVGMLVVTGEFATRAITVTCAGTPARHRVILAKALVVGVAVFALGLVVACLGTVVAAVRLRMLGELGAEHLPHLAAMAAYLALLAVIALGIGALVRHSAGAFTVVVALLVLIPQLLRLLADRFDAPLLHTIGQWTPGPIAGRFIGGEWGDGFALGAWAVASIALGVWALRSRDV